MKRVALPLAIALASAPLFAQGAPVAGPEPVFQVRPGKGLEVRRLEEFPKERQALDVWLGLELKAVEDGAPRLEVQKVFPDSPAQRAGVQVGDKVVALGGRAVRDHASLLAGLSGRHAGERAILTVERSKKVELRKSTAEEGRAKLGVSAAGEDDERGAAASGVAIGEVTKDTAAASAGFEAGDRIAAIDGREIGSFEELTKAIQAHKPGDEVEVRTQRDIAVLLAAHPQLPGRQGLSGNETRERIPGQGGGSSGAFGGQSGGAPGLFSPSPDGRGFWTTPSRPTPPSTQPRGQAPVAPPSVARPADPAMPGLGGRAGDRQPAQEADQALTSQLLEEIRALRREVADLRRQMEALKSAKRKN